MCEELNAGQGGLSSGRERVKATSREQPGAEAFSRSLPVLLLLSELRESVWSKLKGAEGRKARTQFSSSVGKKPGEET